MTTSIHSPSRHPTPLPRNSNRSRSTFLFVSFFFLVLLASDRPLHASSDSRQQHLHLDARRLCRHRRRRLRTKNSNTNTNTNNKNTVRPSIFQELTRRIVPHSEKVNPTVLNYGPRGHPWERRAVERPDVNNNNNNNNNNYNNHDKDHDNYHDGNINIIINHGQENGRNNDDDNQRDPNHTHRNLQIIPQNDKIISYKNQHTYPLSPSDYRPIRLAYHTGALDDEDSSTTGNSTSTTSASSSAGGSGSNNAYNTEMHKVRINTLKERVLPLMAGNFSEMLSVVPVVGGIPLQKTLYYEDDLITRHRQQQQQPQQQQPPQGQDQRKGQEEIIEFGSCFGIFDAYITRWDMDPGIQNADLVVFVSAFESLAGVDICSGFEEYGSNGGSDGGDDSSSSSSSSTSSSSSSSSNTPGGTGGDDMAVASTLAGATGCELDQYDRPVVGLVNFCLGLMDVTTTTASGGETRMVVEQDVVDLFVSVAMHEFTHVLGINSDMMKYYRDANTGEPLTPRPFTAIDDQTRQTIQCAPDGRPPNPEQQTILLPSCNTIKESHTNRGWHSWLVVLPTVTQVARNQFNCQSLEGVMLENQPTNQYDCFGSHFDERLYYTETMSAYFAQEADFFSPLSFALLQDSGWYWPDYRAAEISPFGHGAGCGFVQNDCIVDGQVPDYGRGFFCNEVYDGSPPRFLCDPSATHKAICDLMEGADPPSSHHYFADSSVGPTFDRADWCPIAREGTINCVDGSTVLVFDDGFVAPSVLPEESYSKDSKCFERVDGDSLCLTAFCSREPRVMTVQAGSEMFTCSSDFQLISFTSSTGTPVQFTCPRLSAACPELFCPANCSGKGVCNFEAPTPYCECFDPNDSTDGCYESLPKSPEICERETPTTSNNVNHRPLLDIPSWMIAITMGLFGIL